MESRVSNSRAESLLRKTLRESSFETRACVTYIEALTPCELAECFVLASFFRSILQPLIDQNWLRTRPDSFCTADLRPQQMRDELLALDFLRSDIINASPGELKSFIVRTTSLIQTLVCFMQMESAQRFQEFAKEAMSLIDIRTRHQASFPHTHLSESMYRAFDQLDDILDIKYDLDANMISDPNQKERLYEGAGLGVQTSYSSILLALERANPANGARIVDLGSGYGRVGFVLGLLRPDVDFIGYEYVEHRVENSKGVAKRAGLQRTTFVTQDLARRDFKIPVADIYYMYDPFSPETYGTVLDQLIEVGKRLQITIVTKGRANSWVREALMNRAWSVIETCDSETVCLFRSLPQPKEISI